MTFDLDLSDILPGRAISSKEALEQWTWNGPASLKSFTFESPKNIFSQLLYNFCP